MRLCVLGKLQTFKLQPTKLYAKGHWLVSQVRNIAAAKSDPNGKVFYPFEAEYEMD